VRPGGKVLEAGTGSGSMTHSLSRSVGEKGKVLSYEYHEPRYLKAKEEFEGHGLRNVELSHRNVCKDGFGDVSGVEGVFLDLPAPWEAVPFATKIMRVSPSAIFQLSGVLIQARYHYAYMLFLTMPRTSPQNRHYTPR